MISQQQARSFTGSSHAQHVLITRSAFGMYRYRVWPCSQSTARFRRMQAVSCSCRPAVKPQQPQQGQWHRRPQQAHCKPGTCTTTRAAVIAAASTSEGASRLQAVLSAIDAINAQDPRSVEWQGKQVPYELAYSQWLSEWVAKLAPTNPSEELLIVARGQHVGRWKSPRIDYSKGRQGYLKWREDLKRTHASTVTKAMQEAGYPEASCEKVRRLIMKRDLKTDPEAQAVEDALCLVFLQHQFAELLAKEGADKMVGIVAKTWAKMGEGGRAAALELAPALPEDQQSVVQRALAAKD